MSTPLNLFPFRVAIGRFRDADGKDVLIYMTSEFERALSSLFQRVGGSNGMDTSDLEIFAHQSLPPMLDQSSFETLDGAPVGDSLAALSQLAQSVFDAQAVQIANLEAALSEAVKRLEGIEVAQAAPSQQYIDWSRPGRIGSLTPNTGSFTSLTYSGQLTSTVATGTPPMVVTSITKVANLNVDLLDGFDWGTPGAIGAVTPNTAAFSALTTTGANNTLLGSTSTNTGVETIGANSGVGGGTYYGVRNGATLIAALSNKSRIAGGAYDGTPYLFTNAPLEFNNLIKVPGGTLIQTTSALTNGAAGATGTLTNAPAAGNPTKWIPINDNGTTRYIPSW